MESAVSDVPSTKVSEGKSRRHKEQSLHKRIDPCQRRSRTPENFSRTERLGARYGNVIFRCRVFRCQRIRWRWNIAATGLDPLRFVDARDREIILQSLDSRDELNGRDQRDTSRFGFLPFLRREVDSMDSQQLQCATEPLAQFLFQRGRSSKFRRPPEVWHETRRGDAGKFSRIVLVRWAWSIAISTKT